MARRRSRSQSRRRSRERSLEIATYGMIFVLFLLAILYRALDPTWVSLLGGTILLGSAIVQSQRRYAVNIFTWLGGLLLFGVGLLAFTNNNTVPMGMLLPMAVMVGVVGASLVTGQL